MHDKNGEAKEYVIKHAKEKDVKFIRLWFTDVLGALKSVSITVEELEHALEYGMGFDGSSIEGFARIDESDMVAMPDPTSFRILPWRPTKNAVARMFCDILTPAGKPFEGDPRYVLRRNLENTKRLGYTYYVGTEMEYFYFQNSSGTKQLDIGGYFDQTALDMASDLRRDTVLTLEEMGIPVYSSHHEVAGSQHEIDLRYTDALNMADGVMTFKVVAKEIASKYGVYASFMPKPIGTENGSGMHINVSLYKGSQNLFYDAHDKIRLSKTARYFLGGVLNRAAEMTSITNQWINSYKRLVPGFEAPVYISWASKNRSDLVRVPEYRPGRQDSTRFEYRAPDPACNPYLAFSVLLAAGLEGIEKKIEPPEATTSNVFELSPEERLERGIKTLPKDMHEAIALTEKSSLVKKVLGDHVFNSFIRNKKIEWENYRSQVTDYEINRYLPIL